jgi:hypothetical protein
MREPAVIRRRRGRASLWLLALLLFRAYIPAGFMPASGVPFALELCPVGLAGMPAAHFLHHAGTHDHTGSHDHIGSHDHTGAHADFATCPFGSAPAAGPISHHVDFEAPEPALSDPTLAFQSLFFSFRPQRSHLPRGPPSLA